MAAIINTVTKAAITTATTAAMTAEITAAITVEMIAATIVSIAVAMAAEDPELSTVEFQLVDSILLRDGYYL